MKNGNLRFKPKYGSAAEAELTLEDGKSIKTEFFPTYGENTVFFPTSDMFSASFAPTYGENNSNVPTNDDTEPAYSESGMTDLWTAKVTIYNDIPAAVGEARRFDRFVIGRCQIQGGFIQSTGADGAVRNVVNAKTVITKDTEHYLAPEKYIALPIGEREKHFTVQTGDYVVFGEVCDIIENSREFSELGKKYEKNGFKIMSVSASENGMAVDNITMTNI